MEVMVCNFCCHVIECYPEGKRSKILNFKFHKIKVIRSTDQKKIYCPYLNEIQLKVSENLNHILTGDGQQTRLQKKKNVMAMYKERIIIKWSLTSLFIHTSPTYAGHMRGCGSVTPQQRFHGAAKCWHNTVVNNRISDGV